MAEEYPALIVDTRTGEEPLRHNGQELDVRLVDFWRWAFSDLANNAQRGVLAEYIVARALGVAHGVRREWESCDLTSSSQLRIEVKSAAYLQSWSQKKLSSISFGIRPTHGIEADNTLSVVRERQSDIYVFCVLHHKNKATLDPINLDQWDFYVLPTQVLNEKCPTQKTLAFSVLKTMGPRCVKFSELKQCIQDIEGERNMSAKEIVIE